MSEQNKLAKKILSLGEERFAELMDELLSNPKFSGAVGTAMTQTQKFKAALDRNVSLAMSLVNQPTREDHDKLRKQVRALERQLEDLGEKLEGLEKAAAKLPATPAASAPKAAPRKRVAKKS